VKKLSQERRLLFLIIVMVGIMLLVQFLYVIPEIKKHILETEKQHQEELAQQYALELESSVSYISNQMLDLAQSTEFRTMDLGAQGSILQSITTGSYRINSLSVIDAEGWFVSSHLNDFSLYTTKSYADQPYFNIPFNEGKVYYANPRYYAKSGILSFTMSVPIESNSGERVGVLLGSMDLQETIEQIYSNPLEERVAFLVDREGVVIAHSGIDLFALEEGPLSLDLSEEPLIHHFLSGSSERSLEHKHGDVLYFGTYTIIEKTGFGVIVCYPMDLIIAKSEALTAQLVWINVILFTILTASSLVITNRISAEHEQARKKEQLHFQDIAFLSKTAMQFVDFPPEKDIYHFIGEQLKELVGESIVVINSIDGAKGILTNHAILGMEKYTQDIFKIIGKNPEGLKFDVNNEGLAYLTDGKLHDFKEGLFKLLLEAVPKTVYITLEKLFRQNKIYSMGFIQHKKLLGNAVIFVPKGVELENKETIKLFIEQASIAIQRKQAEQALIESEEQYRSLFNSMLNGFALHEMVYDDGGKPIDYRFIEVNSAFEKITGLKGADIIGKTALEVLPGLEPIWIENYGKVALVVSPYFLNSLHRN